MLSFDHAIAAQVRALMLYLCIVFMYVTSDGLLRISQEEGLSTLWSGTGPSLVLAGNPAIQFMVYEAIKKFLMHEDKRV